MKRFPTSLAAAALLAGAAQAQVSISEIHFNPPGTDDTEEAIELKGPANFDLTGWSIVIIEGDGTATGVVDQSTPPTWAR
jgi:5'-nucleotidase